MNFLGKGRALIVASYYHVVRFVAFAAAVVLCAAGVVGPVQAAKEVPWKVEPFERVSFEEDIKDVLRSILRQNGLQAIFRPGVAGPVTFEFKNMPLQAAFNKLLIENDLDYDFDPKTNVVTIFAAAQQQRAQAIVPIAHVAPSAVTEAVKKFGLGGEVTVDPGTRTALVVGTREQVQALQSLIERLDQAEGKRRTAAIERQKAAVTQTKADIRRKLLEQFLDRKVKVIPLRFATVSATTKVFHGQKVIVPGIEETLNALLGETKKIKEGLTKEQQKQLAEVSPTLTEGVSISTDPRTNAVIARGTDEELERVERVVKQLDRPVPMVEIEVMIVLAQRGVSADLGVNYAFERNAVTTGGAGKSFLGVNTGVSGADPGNVQAGLGATAATAAQGGANTTTVAATAATGAAVGDINTAVQSIIGGFVWRGTNKALQARIEAFEQDNKAQTIAAPIVVTVNNAPARIERRASQFFDVAQNNVASLKEIDVGLKLEITPSVIPREDASEEELIRLNFSARNTALSAGTFAASSASTSGQEVETEVIIPSGRTLVVGGLVDDTRTDNSKGIPWLRDIPVFGALFGTNSSKDDLVETLFFVTPRVVHPEQILPRDVAERRYLENRRFGIAQARISVQEGSSVLTNILITQEEDE